VAIALWPLNFFGLLGRATHGRIVLFLLALLPLAQLRRKMCVEPPRRLHAELERPEREDPLLIATISEHVHAVVKEMEVACATDNPAYGELKQYGSDLDQYESVRLTTECLHYGIAVIYQFFKIGTQPLSNSLLSPLYAFERRGQAVFAYATTISLWSSYDSELLL
jgi:hypothetical protein